MKTNTVILSIEDYNELRDFKMEIQKGNTYRISFNCFDLAVSYVSTDEAIREMAIRLKELEEENKILSEPLESVKKFNWWQFRKWKKQI